MTLTWVNRLFSFCLFFSLRRSPSERAESFDRTEEDDVMRAFCARALTHTHAYARLAQGRTRRPQSWTTAFPRTPFFRIFLLLYARTLTHSEQSKRREGTGWVSEIDVARAHGIECAHPSSE